jgi:glyoxylase-like metal-dependent hydrolase (beta-lactamase superfamily II)
MKQVMPGFWEIDEIGQDVHCYLWEWNQGYTLIDAGFPKDARTIIDALIRNKVTLHAIRRIIVTHADPDHSGGLAQIKRATQAQVVCHAVEKEYLEYPLRRQISSWYMRIPLFAASLIPSFHLRAVVPDVLVVDGQELPEGFIVVHTPGHSPGHISLLHRSRRLLIAGDALSNRGSKLRAPTTKFTADLPNAQRSIWKLAKRYGDDFETVVFGHGPPLMTNGGKRIKGLASELFSSEV